MSCLTDIPAPIWVLCTFGFNALHGSLFARALPEIDLITFSLL
ncbi:Protein of unknown function [Pyronema omphalodes CBS 100304]|uniref:Uncharacterized protein n=1 Tax=Pyronema omphalodes (strain CBS 100304) TaxID=1076935 RepID=U4LTX3_PYROM|nr:Protein of unknown function [Pyronema omphalodes CBS 100304]